ncbi:MAG TPA: hypothetical protein VGB70_13520 [Allosphingosinicella sp.]
MARTVSGSPGGRCADPAHFWTSGTAMKWLKTLTNPFLLGAQGFLAGAVIFFATHPEAAPELPKAPSEQAKTESPRTPA